MNVLTFIFYAALALYFFGVPFPYIDFIIGICALVLAVKSL